MADELRAMQSLANTFGRDYPKNSVIFYEGEAGDEVFFITSGQVRITTTYGAPLEEGGSLDSRKGPVHELCILGPGDIFGEIAILDDSPRSATVVATEDTRAIVFNRTDFYLNIERYPKLAVRLLKVLGKRIRAMDGKLKVALSTTNFRD